MANAWQSWGSDSSALGSRILIFTPTLERDVLAPEKGGGETQYPLVIKLAAQGKHSAESTDAVCLELLCVPGEAASCFS